MLTTIVFSPNLAVLVAGCTSPALRNLHLLTLRYAAPPPGTNHSSPPPLLVAAARNVSSSNTSLVLETLAADAQLEVRASYFGLCVSSPRINGWRCSASADILARLLPVSAPGSASANATKAEDGDGANPADPLGLIHLADEFRRRVVSPSLLFASLLFAALCAYIVDVYRKSDPLRERSDQPTVTHLQIRTQANGTPRTEDPVSESLGVGRMPLHARWMLGMSGGVSAGLALLGIFWQHLCSATAVTLFRAVTRGSVEAHLGAVAAVLGWIAVLLQLLGISGILVALFKLVAVPDSDKMGSGPSEYR